MRLTLKLLMFHNNDSNSLPCGSVLWANAEHQGGVGAEHAGSGRDGRPHLQRGKPAEFGYLMSNNVVMTIQ
ncbi:MAG: hypothetical protein JWL81_3150 [Verrucomicrobiales bacterium]|nr:hypothetical protein [Verrucomicrobiales bacterium]